MNIKNKLKLLAHNLITFKLLPWYLDNQDDLIAAGIDFADVYINTGDDLNEALANTLGAFLASTLWTDKSDPRDSHVQVIGTEIEVTQSGIGIKVTVGDEVGYQQTRMPISDFFREYAPVYTAEIKYHS